MRYNDLLRKVIKYGVRGTNKRTGADVRQLYGVYVPIDLSWGVMPLPGVRYTSSRIAAAELAWILSGQQNITWLEKHTRIWTQFKEPLPQSSAVGVRAAYGYRWRHAFKRDQLLAFILKLQDDHTDRQAVMVTWDPVHDTTPDGPKKMVPCPVAVHGSILNDALHISVMLRSSDIALGLPIDWTTFSLLCDCLATTIGVETGSVTLFLGNAHIYEAHILEIKTALTRKHNITGGVPLPRWSVDQIMENADEYVALMRDKARSVPQPPKTVQLELVL